MYDVVNLTKDCRSVKYTINGAIEVALNKILQSHDHCKLLMHHQSEQMYELIKLAMCGNHGFSSDVCMRNLYMVTCFITF